MERQAPSTRVAPVLLLLLGIGLAGYWIAYFHGLRLSRGVDCSRQLQLAQVPSNGWIIVTSLLGALGLRLERRWGAAMVISAASAMVFLGLLDITFNVRAQTYSTLPWAELAPELFVNALCTIFPAYLYSVVLRSPDAG